MIMTKVEITIQNGKVTWLDFAGEELPQSVKERLVINIKKALE